jgi:hypothetical protein
MPDTTAERSKFVCTPCRKAHKKCDKAFPICRECKQKKLSCKYEKENRDNREKAPSPPKCYRIVRYDPHASGVDLPHPAENELGRSAQVYLHTDFSVECMAPILPFLNLDNIARNLTFFRDVKATRRNEETNTILAPTNVELCLTLTNAGIKLSKIVSNV